MNTVLIYAVKTAIYLLAFYLVYWLTLSRDTSYGRNRLFILFSLATSIIFPFITIQTLKPHNIQFFGKFLSEVFITARSGSDGSTETGVLSAESLQLVYSIYITGVFLVILKLIANLANLIFLILRQKKSGSRIIKFHGFNTSGFSALGYVFINSRLSHEEAGEIIRHEQNHLNQYHFFDIIFIELVRAFQWFNPIVYLFNKSLRAVHEFQADQECLSSGIPVVSYQCLLLSQVFKSKAFKLTNSFSNPSLIKKRMIMMTKKRTSAIANIKLVLVIPVTFLVFLAISAYKEMPASKERNIPLAKTSDYLPASATPGTTNEAVEKNSIAGKIKSQAKNTDETLMPPPPPPPPPPQRSGNEKKDNNEKEKSTKNLEEAPFVVVEEMPLFPGGDAALLKYIGENTNYPENAKKENIQGRVIIRFCVTAQGGISQISVLKGVSPELDNEAMRVVSTLPPFQPGRQGGKPVPVWYMVPITFTLK
jgi:TonB family protein